MAADDTVNNDLTILGSFGYTSTLALGGDAAELRPLRPGMPVTPLSIAEWDQAMPRCAARGHAGGYCWRH
jgi:hypothetical protein